MRQYTIILNNGIRIKVQAKDYFDAKYQAMVLGAPLEEIKEVL